MGSFSAPLTATQIGRDDWMVAKPFTYTADDGRRWHVPAGFVTDFASVPRFFWRVLRPAGGHAQAAVLHDYLYRTPGAAPRKLADQLFREAMAVHWTTAGDRRRAYWAVRMGGSRAYKGGL